MSQSTLFQKRAEPIRGQRLDRFGIAILLFAGLNLNAVAFLVTGGKSVLSPLLLPVTLLLLWSHLKLKNVVPIYVGFALFIGSYLFLGALSDPFSYEERKIFFTYLTTFLLVTAVYFWITSLSDENITEVLLVLKWIFFVASVVTAISPLIAGIVPRLSEESDRFSGLFENPDEAAMAALYGAVLVLCCPGRSIIINISQLVVFAIALALTFSKNGVLIAIAISVILSFRKGSLLRACLVVGFWILMLGAVWFAYDQNLFELTLLQRSRLGELFGILGGEFDEQTTTGRTLLLDYGWERIQEIFPGGAGLGEFHSLEGGYRSPLGQWLGIHNTFLMVLGEAGLLPFLLLLGFVARLLWLSTKRTRFAPVVMGFGIVLLGNMSATHNALAIRFSNVTLGIMIALSARRNDAVAPLACGDRDPRPSVGCAASESGAGRS